MLRIRGKPANIRRNFHYCEEALPPQPDHSPGGCFWNTFRGKLDGAAKRPEHPRWVPVVCDACQPVSERGRQAFFVLRKGGTVQMAYNEKQTQCIALLQETAKALGRLPQKSDFSPEVIGQI